MSIIFVRRSVLVCFAFFVFVLLLTPMTSFAASDPNILTACINLGNGGVRLVEATTPCHANETRVQWNVTGPQGPVGPEGATGHRGQQVLWVQPARKGQ